MKTVVLGVSSGIAAYKSVDLVTLLKEAGVNVSVVMTKSATEMVPQQLFEKASGNKVYSELFENGFDYKEILETRHVDHIDLADSADVVVVAPATANLVAKISLGLADDFLTTMLLATQAPVIICPSMNVRMWQNPVVQENIEKLRKRGYSIIDPEEGALACGYTGKGRLADIEKIKDMVMDFIEKKTLLQGKKILITAGATQENIDAVRYITNRSSGKMGAALADVCIGQGADVLLLRAENAVRPRNHIPEKTFSSGEELKELLHSALKTYDIVFHAAAVGDFTVKEQHGKISSADDISLALAKTPKILNEIKKIAPKIKLIGFKAEYGLLEEELIESAKKRLDESQADAIIANDLAGDDRGFQADTNEVIIVLKDGSQKKISLRSKYDIAKETIKFLLERQAI